LPEVRTSAQPLPIGTPQATDNYQGLEKSVGKRKLFVKNISLLNVTLKALIH
jgi:hypothetical protein